MTAHLTIEAIRAATAPLSREPTLALIDSKPFSRSPASTSA
jgi:hypothetical protein